MQFGSIRNVIPQMERRMFVLFLCVEVNARFGKSTTQKAQSLPSVGSSPESVEDDHLQGGQQSEIIVLK